MDLEPLTERSAAVVATWFEHDEEGRRRLGFYAGDPKWWRLVEADDNRHGFVVRAAGEAIGFVDLEDHNGVVNVSIYVRPEHRWQGHGMAILLQASVIARSIEGARRLLAEVEPDNTASIRACARVGMMLRPERNAHNELVFALDLNG